MKMKSKALFNDRWLMIVGILITGIVFPIIFGMRPANPDFYQWMMISISVTAVSWGISRQFGMLLWKKFPWNKKPLVHMAIVLAYIFLFTAAIIGLVYLVNLLVEGKTVNYWEEHQRFHLIILFVFIFSVTIHEAVYLFFLWKKELTRSADLEKENMQSKFEALKNHMNPHFLFNSMGTLSSLINSDQQKATQYVNEFSKIYRYFLQVNSNEVVTLAEELDFLYSYIFLQKIRYGEGFVFNSRIDRKFYNSYVLPLTLQLLVENALKHNSTMQGEPLLIDISVDEESQIIVVKNNLQPRRIESTTKTGLKNLEERYSSFVGKTIVYPKSKSEFIVEIPIISNE
ncbi:MAG: sensor histidine kinase [Prolixibacteraceae bacterium]